jgi:hypothetical protein
MRGGRQLAKPDVGRPLDGRVRAHAMGYRPSKIGVLKRRRNAGVKVQAACPLSYMNLEKRGVDEPCEEQQRLLAETDRRFRIAEADRVAMPRYLASDLALVKPSTTNSRSSSK